MEKSGLLIDVICVLFLLCSHLRSSSVSVVFDFNASLNDFAPVSPILLPVDLMRMEKSGLLMDAICVLFLLFSLSKQSFMSVVFVFSASLNDVAPLSPMLLPVYMTRMKKSELIMDVICVHISNRVLKLLCLISMLHSMISLLYLQFHRLLSDKECYS